MERVCLPLEHFKCQEIVCGKVLAHVMEVECVSHEDLIRR